jgi:16S rRNA processing protein RimM
MSKPPGGDGDRVTVGYVARPHGVRGELRVQLHDPASTSLYDVPRAYFAGRELAIDSVRPTSGALLVKVEGVDDRDAAQALAGSEIAIDRASIELAEGEFLIGDLPGCAVFDTTGQALGNIVKVWHGPQDLLVIHDDTHERLLPLVPAFVLEVDIAAKRVVVELPEDLPIEPLVKPAKPPKPPKPGP